MKNTIIVGLTLFGLSICGALRAEEISSLQEAPCAQKALKAVDDVWSEQATAEYYRDATAVKRGGLDYLLNKSKNDSVRFEITHEVITNKTQRSDGERIKEKNQHIAFVTISVELAISKQVAGTGILCGTPKTETKEDLPRFWAKYYNR